MARFDLAYPRALISPEARAAMYFPMLEDLTLEQLHAGIDRWLRGDHAFPPAPGELRTAALGTVEDRAALAWARVRRAVLAGYGGYRPLDFQDPVLHAAVVAMGGWQTLYSLGFRDTEAVEWATARKEFLQLYAIYATAGAPAATPPTLAAAEPHERYLDDVVTVSLELSEINRPPRPALPAAQPSETFEVAPKQVRDLIAGLAEKTRVSPPAKGSVGSNGRAARDQPSRPVFTPLTPEEKAEHEAKKRLAVQRMREAGQL